MKETTLWDHLRPVMGLRGQFQKVSDRFTPGVPDCLGASDAVPYAFEFKVLKGVRIQKVKFRPGQKEWLRDWVTKGRGTGWIVSSTGATVYVHRWEDAWDLEAGLPADEVFERALLVWEKTRRDRWSDFVDQLLALRYN